MTKYYLPYFGEIDFTALDEYYDIDVDVNGKNINIDINFEGKFFDQNLLEAVKNFLGNIDKFDQQNKSFMEDNFQKEGNALKYVNFYFDELKDELSGIVDFENTNIAKERQLLDKLKLIRVGIYPDNNSECYGIFDYSIEINGEPCSELLVVKTDEEGNLDHVTWES